MCDKDEKCGGIVYSSSEGGKCELKDRTKMYPVGLRVVDHNKKLMLKVPSINGTIKDPECAAAGKGEYKMIDSTQYRYYPDGGAMSSTTKCDVTGMVPKEGNLTMPDIAPVLNAVQQQRDNTNNQIAEYGKQLAVSKPTEGFRSSFREGLENKQNVEQSTYGKAMVGVRDTIQKIGNAQYQRERLNAIKDETNKRLISESYKFILWSILAILTVMALLKIKEMFGQDDADDGDGDGGGGGGGVLGFITSLFGIGSALKMDDIADKTEEVKSMLADAGANLQQTGENLASGITEGANTLVNSVNDAAVNAVDGAKNMADQVSEKAAEAVNSIGAPAGGGGSENTPTTTGGKRRGKSPRRK
jgi:hypothetical protein